MYSIIFQVRNGALFGIDNLLSTLHLTRSFSEPTFISIFDSYLTKRQSLTAYIGPLIIFSGFGFSVECRKAYGLTLQGIETILTLENIDVPVIKNKTELKQFIDATPMHSMGRAIINSAIFNDGEERSCLHVYAIAYYKMPGHDLVYLYDSMGGDIDAHTMKQYFCNRLTIFIPKKVRQQYGEGVSTCHAFAIKDLLLIEKHPPVDVDVSQSHHEFSSNRPFFSKPSSIVEKKNLICH